MLARIQRWLSVDTMLPAAERLGPVGTTKPVSYTHLDVYKRQVLSPQKQLQLVK